MHVCEMNEIREELTEEQQKADAVQNQDVRNVSNVVVAQELHLLFGGAHEEEPTGVKQEGWQVLEAVDLVVVLAVRSDIRGSLVAEDEADLDDPGQTCCHERVAENSMNMCA